MSNVSIIKNISKAQAFKLLLGQIVVPNDSNKDKWNRIIDKILELPILSLTFFLRIGLCHFQNVWTHI